MSDSLTLARIGDGLVAEACGDRWRLAPASANVRMLHPAGWPQDWLVSSTAWQLAIQLTHLLDLGMATLRSEEIAIPWESFEPLILAGFSLPLLSACWSPLRIAIDGDTSNFQPGYFLGDMEIRVERAGRYVRRAGSNVTWLLGGCAYRLIEELEHRRAGERQWISLGFISAYTKELCVSTSGWLAENEVIFPACLQGGRSSGIYVAEASRREFRHALATRPPGSRQLKSYAPGGGWKHFVLDDDQLQALENSGRDTTATAECLPQAGRIASRSAIFNSNPESLPVWVASARPNIHWRPPPYVASHSAQNINRAYLEASVAADFGIRGYDTLVLPKDCWTGASMIAVSDIDVQLVRVADAEEDVLGATARMAAEHRRLSDLPFGLTVVTTRGVLGEVRSRAAAAGIQILGPRELTRHAHCPAEFLAEHNRRRFLSLRQALDELSTRRS